MLINSRVLGKLHRLSELQLLHPQNGDDYTHLTELLGDVKDLHAHMVFYPESGTQKTFSNAGFSPPYSKPCTQHVTGPEWAPSAYSQGAPHVRVATGDPWQPADSHTASPADRLFPADTQQARSVVRRACTYQSTLYLKDVPFPKHVETPVTFISGRQGISQDPTVAKGQIPSCCFS